MVQKLRKIHKLQSTRSPIDKNWNILDRCASADLDTQLMQLKHCDGEYKQLLKCLTKK